MGLVVNNESIHNHIMNKKLLTLLFATGLLTAAQQGYAAVSPSQPSQAAENTAENKASLPFATTTIVDGEFAPATIWYAIRIGHSGAVLTPNGDAEFIALETVHTTYEDAHLWCFVGDATNGFSLYNKAVGTGKRLASPKAMTGQDGGTAFPVMKADGDTQYSYLWSLSPSDKIANVAGFFLSQQGVAANKLNNRNGKLAFWTTGQDAGSTLRVEIGAQDIAVNTQNGTWQPSAPESPQLHTWKAKGDLAFTLSAEGEGSLGYNGKSADLQLNSGGNAREFTITAPEGYFVAGYSFSFTNSDKKANMTVTAGDKSVTANRKKEACISVEDVNAPTATFVVTGKKAINTKHFTVQLKHSFVELEPQQNLFVTNSQSAHPYRIPAIAAAPNGDVFAISDYRPCGMDIGYGEVDIKCRISKDNGKTWGEEFFIADGKGGNSNYMTTGFGDAAIVADCEQNKLLVMMVCGRTICWHGRWNPSKIGDAHTDSVNRVASIYLTYNEATGEWEKSEIKEMTDHIYSLFLDGETPTVSSMFIGSGKICQSRKIKVGEYYRLYCSMWTRDGGNRVIYSDDFGASWKVLGTIKDRPAPGGDEPKVEELPDGSVLLSSRCTGRYFNIYTYTDEKTGKGAWSTVALSDTKNNGVGAVSNSTNGEILIVPVVRKSDGVKTYLALQSVPFGPGRANVGIYYKELTDRATDYATPALFAANWDGSHQSSYMSSAYTTMTLQKDNTIGFLYEESTFGRDYTIVYKNYTIDYITGGRYEFCKH